MSIFEDKTKEMPDPRWSVRVIQCPEDAPREGVIRMAVDPTQLEAVRHVARPRKGHAY